MLSIFRQLCYTFLFYRIHNKDAEEKLEKAEREVEEAFKEASLMGVMMYDRPDGPRRSCEIEKSSIIGGVSSHTIAASFETAFEVDKEVAMAVKIAFVRLARCPSSSKKDEFKDLIHKICENPEEFEFDRDIDPAAASPHGSMDVESKQNLVQLMSDSTFSSKDYKNELNSESNGNPVEPKLDQNLDKEECPYYSRTTDTESNQTLVHAVPDHFSTSNKEEFSELNDETKENPIGPKLDPNFDHIDLSFSESSNSESDQRLVNSMCYRPSSSAKEEIKKQNDDVSDFGLTDIEYKSNLVSVMYDRLSLLSEDEISSLAIIVATTGLNAALERTMGPSDPTTTNFLSRNHQAKKRKSGNDLPSLDKLLVKHVSKFEREVQEAKTSNRVESTVMKTTGDDLTCPDLGSILVKHVSKLEREIHSFRDSLKKQRVSGPDSDERNKVNLNMMDGEKMPLSHLPGKENLEPVNAEALESQSLPTVEDNRKSQRFEETQSKGLDQILVKHKSKLEKAKLDASDQHWSAPALDSKKKAQNLEMGPSLEQVLVKHQSNLEKSKPISMQNSTEQRVKSTSTWLEARNQKLREEWGGLSLANSLKPHLSRLERERVRKCTIY